MNHAASDDRPDPQATMHKSRAQENQRLQVGISGLAAMILLIAVAQIVMDQAREAEALVVPEAAPTVAPSAAPTAASDPLADAGVGPDLPSEPAASAASPTVPDARKAD